MSEFRHEEKILINKSDFYILKNRLSNIFPLDSHVEKDGFYIIKSLYFDDYEDSALFDKINGVDRREKFRIRTYGTENKYFLEKKSKINGLCKKEKEPLDILEVKRIIEGQSYLLKEKTDLEKELYSKIKGNGLKPKVVVSYKRVPFVYKPGNVRITLDYDIRADYKADNILKGAPESVPVEAAMLMEIKWDEYLPDIVKLATSITSRRAQAFSKYAICRMYK